jgi:L-ascorbate metabolism protein UlaG (beta-lactamase superfamily)
MKRTLIAIVVIAFLASAWLLRRINDYPNLAPYAEHFLSPADEATAAVRVTFLGVSTLLIDDGETAILTDGFFSRPGKLRTLLRKIEPDRGVIGRSLGRAGIERLAAVVVVHSHYDHAMDAPEVAQRTGALLIGSESTANVGRGWGLAEDRMRVVTDSDTLTFGRFRLKLLRSRHFPHGMAMGEIREPLRPPARASDYLEGGSYSVLVEHEGRALLVQGSAGFLEGALRDQHADVVFLGIGGLGGQDDGYRDAYWREVVQTVGARRVIPIHWDDFTLPLDEPLLPMPRLVDDFDTSMKFLLQQAGEEGVDLKLLRTWAQVDPFVGL